MDKPPCIDDAPWNASRTLRQGWLEENDGIPIKDRPLEERSIENLDRLFSDVADSRSPAGSNEYKTDYAAQLVKTWHTLEKNLREGDWGSIVERLPEISNWTIPPLEEQWSVLLDLFATLPESMDAGMKEALAEARRLRGELTATASRLCDLSDDLSAICAQHAIDSPSISHLGNLAHEIANTVNLWGPAPPHGQEFAEIGDGNARAASSLVRHFDTRLRKMLGVSLPPTFEVGNTDLARIINALLRRKATTSQGVLKARKALFT